MIQYIPYAAVLLTGLCVGSFLNVCIHRIPLSKSIVFPGSTCPSCNRPIRFFDNIPLLSYLLLRGKCRACKTVIPVRYPLIEAVTGLFALVLYLKFGGSAHFIVYFIFTAVLITVSVIDLDHRIIPDVISIPGIPLFFLGARLIPEVTLYQSLAGIFLGGGSLYAVAWIYMRLKNMEGMGGGDIKLLAMMGGLIGWQGVFFTLFTASALGSAVGLGIVLKSGGTMKYALPFGPFLSAGALLHVLFGPEIIGWYFSLLA